MLPAGEEVALLLAVQAERREGEGAGRPQDEREERREGEREVPETAMELWALRLRGERGIVSSWLFLDK